MPDKKTMKNVIQDYQLKKDPKDKRFTLEERMIDTLLDWHYRGELNKIEEFLSQWDERSQEYWKSEVEEAIKEETREADPAWGIDNLDGVNTGDIFVVKYYGITVILAVALETDKHRVKVYELATKRIKQDGKPILVLCEDKYGDMKPTRTGKTMIVTGRNGWTVTDFWVETKAEQLLIPITVGCPLYKKALELGYRYPATGILHARKFDMKLNRLMNTCWDVPRKFKSNKNNNHKC